MYNLYELFFMYDYGHGMKRKGSVAYVVVLDYGKWQAHYMCRYVWLWKRISPLYCTYLGRFKGGFNYFSKYQYKQKANEKLIVWLWVFRLTLKGMKLLSNKPWIEQAYNAQGSAKDMFSLNPSRHHIY
jgi:hypothetical protein